MAWGNSPRCYRQAISDSHGAGSTSSRSLNGLRIFASVDNQSLKRLVRFGTLPLATTPARLRALQVARLDTGRRLADLSFIFPSSRRLAIRLIFRESSGRRAIEAHT
jgi:hypothetical protein